MSKDPDNIILPEGVSFARDDEGLFLTDGRLTLRLDFRDMLPRLRPGNLQGELLVKAAGANKKRSDNPRPLLVLDATAGLGEDSLLLAGSGCRVIMFERNPVMAALLGDALDRAKNEPALAQMASRMALRCDDSITALAQEAEALQEDIDVVYLDPMFPKRRKSAMVGKKFQLLHHLEEPCEDEEALLGAALEIGPSRIIIKRPVKGPYLAGIKPDFSLAGKAVRYDCLLPGSRAGLRDVMTQRQA